MVTKKKSEKFVIGNRKFTTKRASCLIHENPIISLAHESELRLTTNRYIGLVPAPKKVESYFKKYLGGEQ